jgi:hypothetical protein
VEINLRDDGGERVFELRAIKPKVRIKQIALGIGRE